MRKNEDANLNDMADQFLLNFNVFTDYVIVSQVNMTTSVVQEALFPEYLKPYPLDHTNIELIPGDIQDTTVLDQTTYNLDGPLSPKFETYAKQIS